MEQVQPLLKCIARTFYDTEHAVIMDGLMLHQARVLRDEDVAKILSVSKADAHKLCATLVQARLISQGTRPEILENGGFQKNVPGTYYYVDYRAAIDVIKYRMYRLHKEFEITLNETQEAGYNCPLCKMYYDFMEVLSLPHTTDLEFICERCDTILIYEGDTKRDTPEKQRLALLSEQTKGILKMLKEVDQVVVPENTLEKALREYIPVVPLKTTDKVKHNDSNIHIAKGNTQTCPPVEVKITDTTEKTAQEIIEEHKITLKQAKNNALPSWHARSTVTPNALTIDGIKEAAAGKLISEEGRQIEKILDTEQKKIQAAASNSPMTNSIVKYYEELAAKTKLQKNLEEESESQWDESDEDNEADFLNVTPGNSDKLLPEDAGRKEEEAEAPRTKRAKVEA
ncbi:hypothetical protein RUND412_004608 [Rhizina undulata]